MRRLQHSQGFSTIGGRQARSVAIAARSEDDAISASSIFTIVAVVLAVGCALALLLARAPENVSQIEGVSRVALADGVTPHLVANTPAGVVRHRSREAVQVT